MSFITCTLPKAIVIGENSYKIKTDHKTWLGLACIVENEEIEPIVKEEAILKVFIDEPKSDLEELLKAIENFSQGYRNDHNKKESPSNERIAERAIDYSIDSLLIYSAFKQAYSIDLRKDRLHWWEFLALIYTLPEDTQLSKIVNFRVSDTSKMTGETKKYYEKMKSYYSLDNQEEETLEQAKLNMITFYRNQRILAGIDNPKVRDVDG